MAHMAEEAIEAFKRDGYVIERGHFSRRQAEEAAQWLKAQDQASLARSWTEQEPAVPLAVFSAVHQGSHPIAQMANDHRMLSKAAELMRSPVYIRECKVNVKAAWCGTVEYYHQDLVYWKDRGYPRTDMLSCMTFLDPHGPQNAGLHVMPGTHRIGFQEHKPFININGLSKFMVPPEKLTELYRAHGLVGIEGEPGDVLFFHTSLIHGSSHNSFPDTRMVILSQLNLVGNEPVDVTLNARRFNLQRANMEYREAERRYKWFKEKYEKQLASEEITFTAPVPEHEKR